MKRTTDGTPSSRRKGRPPPSSRRRPPPSSQRSEPAVLPRFDFRVDFAAASERGSRRASNEDAVLCRPEAALFAIADGLSAHPAGALAARVAIAAAAERLSAAAARAILDRYAAEPALEHRRAVFGMLVEAMHAADAAVRAAAAEHGRAGMGSTLDVVLLVRDRAFVAHVGDARVYLVRPKATLQITHDHASFDPLRTTGKRRRREPAPLARSIGHSSLVVDTLFVDLAPGDCLVLCTDGALAGFDDEPALARMCRGGRAADICRTLCAAARGRDAGDDASAIVVCVREPFVRRGVDAGLRAHYLAVLANSPLFSGLAPAAVLSALAAGVEVEIAPGETVPATAANDRVAYVVLDGVVEIEGGRRLGESGLVHAEALLDVPARGAPPRVAEHARLLRIRHDDFREVCRHDAQLAAALYERLARHVATR